MTVFPGSMDHLYYSGVLPYIPYEAYERPVYQITPPYQHGMGMADPETAWTINEIHRIKAEGPRDTFASSSTCDSVSYRESIINSADSTKDANCNKIHKSMLIKGLLATGVVATTLFLLLKGKKPAGTTNTSFWSKLNPLNWFK